MKVILENVFKCWFEIESKNNRKLLKNVGLGYLN